MTAFHYQDEVLHAGSVSMETIASQAGTPVYVYSRDEILNRFKRLQNAFSALQGTIYYSVKSLSNLSVLRLLREAGSSFDVVSGGELERALAAGAGGEDIVFAGVGKTDLELERGLLVDIHLFNLESEEEADRLDAIAGRHGLTARVAVRVNPDVDPRTHTYITTGKRENKFGLDLDRTERLLERHRELANLEFRGFHIHLGSQIGSPDPYLQAIERVLPLADKYREQGVPLETLDIGGGFGITYRDEAPFAPEDLAAALQELLAGRPYRIGLEPGRFISGNSGVLLTRVLGVKRSGTKRFVIVDGAMTDLIRPSLYKAYHHIWPVRGAAPPWQGGRDDYAAADIVGPVCESGDFLGLGRPFPEVSAGDLVAVFSAGAYGFVMASNYNTRPRPAEILVENDGFRLVRRRETVDDLLGPEIGL